MKKFLMVTVLAVLLSTTNLFAETYVSGTIVNETWNSSGSPYYVEGNILVAGLTIEPGVRVEFLGDYVFEVAGVLTAIGTEEDQILFTKADTYEDGWQGIFFNFSSPGSEIAYCTIEGSINSGIRINNSEPTIRDCIITDNVGTKGGGVSVDGTSIFRLDDCKVTNNSVSGYDVMAGGIWVGSGAAILKNCVIEANSVSGTRSGAYSYSRGGGIHINGNLTLIGCNVLDNSSSASVSGNYWTVYAYSRGGGISVAGTLTLTNSKISGNSAETSAIATGPGGGYAYSVGGGVYVDGTLLNVTNCIIDNNSVPAASDGSKVQRGGGVFVDSGVANITNCTIIYNENEGLSNESGAVTSINSIFYFNTGAQISGDATVTYSDVQDGYEGDGNINFNPIFNNCLQILPGSLCIDAGNPDSQYNDVCLPPSLGGVRNDMGAHGGPDACQWCVADFSVSPTKGIAPLTVNFTDQSTGTVDSWNWSFGDGSTSNEKNPSHTYTHHGIYKVTLTVICPCPEGSDTETKTGYIRVEPNKAMPWIPLLLLDE